MTNRQGQANCSWVASLRNAYGPYARAETDIVRLNRVLRPLCLAASHAAEALLAAGGLKGGNFLHNWLLATNLYPPDLTAADLLGPLDDICRRDPILPVIVRSLTPALHAPLLADLADAGFLLFPSRQIWILPAPDAGAWRKRRDARQDLRLADSTAADWTWITTGDFTDRDYTRALALYQRLYRERYPAFNPDYTERFLRTGVASGFLELHGLRRRGATELSGFIGLTRRGDVSATSLLGYDLDAPISDGLYRRLTLRAFLQCAASHTTLHCSSGAGAFKFSRGAQAHVEFAAVWAHHLPSYRRLGLRALAASVRLYAVPFLEKHRF